MLDLHCHILPGIDDGASDLATAVEMARIFAGQGVELVACTPHILPGLYHNDGPQIRRAIDDLRAALKDADIKLDLVCGSDAHMAPDFVGKLKRGNILALADSRYVLVEPPHHIAPVRLEQFFFDILVSGYVPVLTHPERLTWINNQYTAIQRLAQGGVWMQITSGSLIGQFGRSARYWAERMLDEGLVHFLASDAHDTHGRPPNLQRGREAAARRVGEAEAEHLVVTRPRGIIANELPSGLPIPIGITSDRASKRA
jgi:protein-tyrosine phosphatase